MPASDHPLAIVTGASSGIGYELAKCCAHHGFDLLIAADEPQINSAADEFRKRGVTVKAIEIDLATVEGNERLLATTRGWPMPARD
jgi:short-subunit dehydrogenase